MDFTDAHAGNYSGVLTFPFGGTAASVRKNITAMQEARIPFKYLFRQAATVSNMSTFPSETTALGGCKELLHVFQADFRNVATPKAALAYVFRARPGQLGVMLYGVESQIQRRAPFESNEQVH